MTNFCHDRRSTAALPLGEPEPAGSIHADLFLNELSWGCLLEVIPQVVWSANADGITALNQRWQEYTGASKAEALGWGFFNFVHPEDRDCLQTCWQQAQKCPKPWEMQFRLSRSDGTYGWVLTQVTPAWGKNGSFLGWAGTCTDIDRIKQAQFAGEREREFLQAAIANLPQGVVACDTDGQPVLWNRVARSFHQLPDSLPALEQQGSEAVPQRHLMTYCRPDGKTPLPPEEIPLFRALKGEPTPEVEVAVRPLSEATRGVKARSLVAIANPIIDRRGNKLGAVMAVRELSQRNLGEEAMYFLAQASGLLGASLDYQTTLENLAKLIVPYFADWCAINAIAPGGTCRCAAVAHVEMSKEQLVWVLQQRYPAGPDGTYSYLQPLRDGARDACFEVSDHQLAAIALDPEQRQLLRSLRFKSYICLPLRLGQQIFGSILFVRSESGHLYTNASLALAEDLARRAALAIEKALLYREAKTTGENLRQAIQVLDEQQQQLRTLQRLANLLNQRIADLQGLLGAMVDAVADAVADAQFCLLALHDSEEGRLKLTAVSGIGNLPLGKPIATVDGLLYRVFATGKSELVRRESKPEFCGSKAPTAVYAVAIESVQAGRLGVLAIGNWEDPCAFNAGAQRLLEAVGKQAAIAIDNARMIETLEQREQLLERQNQVLAEQNRELDSQRQRIQLQNLQLLEAAKVKSQFLNTMSHELRTPMNAIIGFSQLLLRQRQDSLSPNQGEMVQRILQNGKSLLVLIDDILDLSKMEGGRRSLELEEVDLAHLAIATVLEFSPLANEKNLAISVCVYLQNRCIVNDSARLRQVLVNLLSNAVKFTDRGGVYVHVWESAFDRLVIVIRDTGIGIDHQDLPHIFEMFRQVDQTTKRKYPGTGLGLAIATSLVEMMNGTISVESQPGKGSVFRIELPRQVSKVA